MVAGDTRMTALAPPRPAALRHLNATDSAGVLFLAASAAITAAGLWLSFSESAVVWGTGQILLGLAMVEWFVLLHECGHNTLFRSRTCNTVAGHVAGVFALIPFALWKHVHHLHHKWTGWQDLDPTTSGLVPRQRRALERRIVTVLLEILDPALLSRLQGRQFLESGSAGALRT